jgi:hypothetical protein
LLVVTHRQLLLRVDAALRRPACADFRALPDVPAAVFLAAVFWAALFFAVVAFAVVAFVVVDLAADFFAVTDLVAAFFAVAGLAALLAEADFAAAFFAALDLAVVGLAVVGLAVVGFAAIDLAPCRAVEDFAAVLSGAVVAGDGSASGAAVGSPPRACSAAAKAAAARSSATWERNTEIRSWAASSSLARASPRRSTAASISERTSVSRFSRLVVAAANSSSARELTWPATLAGAPPDAAFGSDSSPWAASVARARVRSPRPVASWT